MEDQLTQLRDLFYMGSYESVIQSDIRLSNDLSRGEYKLLRLRSKLALGQLGTSEVQEILDAHSSSPAEMAVAHVAQYMSAKETSTRKNALEKLHAVNTATSGSEVVVRTMLACCMVAETELCGEDRLLDAMNLLEEGGTLENAALRTQLVIMADRIDLADQIQATMLSTYEEAPVTKLTSAWCNMVNGNFQESYLTFGDLESYLNSQEVTKVSVPLLNGKAVANMHRQQWAEALEDLQAAEKEIAETEQTSLSGGGAPSNDVGCLAAVTLSNLITLYNNTRQYSAAEEAYETLARQYPTHPMVTITATIDSVFDAFQKSL